MSYIELLEEFTQAIELIEEGIRSQLIAHITPIYTQFQHNLELYSELAEDRSEYEENYYLRLNAFNKVVSGDRSDYHTKITMCDDILPLVELVDDFCDELNNYISVYPKYKLIRKFTKDISRDRISADTLEILWESYGNYNFYNMFESIDNAVWLLPFKYDNTDNVYLKQDTTSGHYGYSFNTKVDRIHLGAYYYRSHVAAIYAAMKHCDIII